MEIEVHSVVRRESLEVVFEEIRVHRGPSHYEASVPRRVEVSAMNGREWSHVPNRRTTPIASS